jgi:hypothetical protein
MQHLILWKKDAFGYRTTMISSKISTSTIYKEVAGRSYKTLNYFSDYIRTP